MQMTSVGVCQGRVELMLATAQNDKRTTGLGVTCQLSILILPFRAFSQCTQSACSVPGTGTT